MCPDLGARIRTLIRGQVVYETALDRTELVRLPDDTAKSRAKVRRLADMFNRREVLP